MARSFPTQRTRSVVLDAGGAGSVTFTGPGPSWETIAVDSIALRSDSEALPLARLYRGSSAVEGTLMATEQDGGDGAFLGGGGADSLAGGETWTVEWSGGDPGATCTATLTGTFNGL